MKLVTLLFPILFVFALTACSSSEHDGDKKCDKTECTDKSKCKGDEKSCDSDHKKECCSKEDKKECDSMSKEECAKKCSDRHGRAFM